MLLTCMDSLLGEMFNDHTVVCSVVLYNEEEGPWNVYFYDNDDDGTKTENIKKYVAFSL